MIHFLHNILVATLYQLNLSFIHFSIYLAFLLFFYAYCNLVLKSGENSNCINEFLELRFLKFVTIYHPKTLLYKV
jgi:hypothetical protein